MKLDLKNDKLLALEEIPLKRRKLLMAGKRLVLTNGCFDLLHVGHVSALSSAKACGDILWVALNGDESIRRLKGPSRPIQSELERAYILSALACVDGVFIFHDVNLAKEISLVQPDVYVKSGDYTLEKLNPLEANALKSCHADIRFLPFIDGFSTTNAVKRIKNEKLLS